MSRLDGQLNLDCFKEITEHNQIRSMESPVGERDRKDPLSLCSLMGKYLPLREHLAPFEFELGRDTSRDRRVLDRPCREVGSG